MKTIKSYFINIGLILLIGGISLYFSIGKKLPEVVESIKNANPIYIIILSVIMLIYYLIDGYSLVLFGRKYKKDFTYKQGFINGLAGTLFNGLTPSSSGGQFAQVFVFNNQGIPPTVSSSILLMAFISYQVVLIGFTIVIMIIQSSYYLNEGMFVTSMAAIGFIINFVVTIALFLGATSQKFQDFLINSVLKLFSLIHIVKNYEDTSEKIRIYFSDFRKELKNLSHNKELFLKVSLCNVLKLTIIYSVPFFACLALNIPLHFTQLFNFIGLASIINLINTFLPIPGASGGSEGCYMILFGFLGQAAASSSMFLWRIFSFYYGLIISLIGFIISKDTKK